MDHVIYRGYIVNRRFFIYCSLATHSVSAAPAASITSSPLIVWTGLARFTVENTQRYVQNYWDILNESGLQLRNSQRYLLSVLFKITHRVPLPLFHKKNSCYEI